MILKYGPASKPTQVCLPVNNSLSHFANRTVEHDHFIKSQLASSDRVLGLIWFVFRHAPPTICAGVPAREQLAEPRLRPRYGGFKVNLASS